MDKGGANSLSKLSGLQQQQLLSLIWDVPAAARTAACAGLVRHPASGLCSLDIRKFLDVQLVAGRMLVDDDSLFGAGFK